MFQCVLQVIFVFLFSVNLGYCQQYGFSTQIENLVRKWAPLVFLAPGEVYYPLGVSEFLDNMITIPYQRNFNSSFDYRSANLLRGAEDFNDLPKGRYSESWYLVTKRGIDYLLNKTTSFLYGKNPQKYPIPVYSVIKTCSDQRQRTARILQRYSSDLSSSEFDDGLIDNSVYEFGNKIAGFSKFHVTYWMFYPFSQGKAVCTVDMGPLGSWPIPKVNNYCYGSMQQFGSHVGDWEHVSLLFENPEVPSSMYVSTHDVGAYYRYSIENNRFEYVKHEIRKGILQRPMFPPTIKLTKPGQHPILFSAKGSHGLWSSPGKHRFVRIPRLYDQTGYGVPWSTWKNIEFLSESSFTDRNWLKFRGRWGNPKNQCHPVSRLGINICKYTNGPTGIPLKPYNFQCNAIR